MEAFEETLKAATDRLTGVIPGATCVVVDQDGTYLYKHISGCRSISPDSAPLDFDAVYWYASLNKLITSIAALQAVERGLIGLDEPLDKHMPEFTSQPIIGPGADGSPFSIRQATKPVTLRHLLTHSSGAVYDMMNPLLTEWRVSRGEKAYFKSNTVVEDNAIPRTFEAGESWNYGQSLDWAGLLVARLNNTTLEQYIRENIAKPLDITTFTFSPGKHPDVEEKLLPLYIRNEDGGLVDFPRFPDPKEDNGGGGLYGSVHDYSRVLADLLKSNPTLLRKETADMLFEPQFSEGSEELKGMHFNGAMTWGAVVGGSMEGVKPNHGLGGFVNENDVNREEYEKPKRTLSWSGATGMTFRINREKGIAMVFGTTVLPWGDKEAQGVGHRFETAVWRNFGK